MHLCLCLRPIVTLFSVVFNPISAVHKFDFRLVAKQTPNKRRTLKRWAKPFARKFVK